MGPAVNYINTQQGQAKGWPLLQQEDTTSLPTGRPEGRPPIKAALLDGSGQEDGVHA